LELTREIERVHKRWTRLYARVVSLARKVSDLVSCLLSLFCQVRSLGTPTLESNRRRTQWLSCSAPLTRGIPASIFATVHGLWMQDAARIRGHFCSFCLDVMSDYGTDHRLNDRYTLCDHGWLLHNHRFDNCVKHDDISQLSSSPTKQKASLRSYLGLLSCD